MRKRKQVETTGYAAQEAPQTDATEKEEEGIRDYKEVEPEKDKHALLKPKRVIIRAIITHDKS